MTDLAAALVARVRDEGGFTVDARSGEAPTSGFAVHAGDGARVLPAAAFFADGPAVLAELLSDPAVALLGAFYDRGAERVVLSRVERFDDRERALAAGRERHQTDVYDLAAHRCLPTGYVRSPVRTGARPPV